jgi:antibiotic biosynthesis monooxygenase (ABM) superfamily enzyme
VPSRDSLVTLIPAGTRYDEVVARFGRPDEEHERITSPGRRTLLYRGGNGSEHQEVAIEIHDDRVREVTCITSR